MIAVSGIYISIWLVYEKLVSYETSKQDLWGKATFSKAELNNNKKKILQSIKETIAAKSISNLYGKILKIISPRDAK